MSDKKIKTNTEAFERDIFVMPSGFREYDARWLYPDQINLRGIQLLGMGIGTIMQEEDHPAEDRRWSRLPLV